jgi:phage-related baseplate assembly protein
MSVVAELLDFSRLPPPEALLTLSFKTSFEEAKARLVEIFTANGIPFNVEKQETDSGVLILRVNNWRELLIVAAINRVYKQTLTAFATGSSLDHIAATLHFMRRLDGELDDRFRARIQLEAENKSGGRLAGYKADCLAADLDVTDVGAWFDDTDPLRPTVRLAVMGPAEGEWKPAVSNDPAVLILQWDGATGTASSSLVGKVQLYVDQDHVKQATDIVQVSAISVREVVIDVTLQHLRGPDPALLRTTAAEGLKTMIASRRRPGRDLPLEAIVAAASVGGVEKPVVDSPEAGIVASKGELVQATTIIVRSAYTDG